MSDDTRILRERLAQFRLQVGDVSVVTPYWTNWDVAPYHLDAPGRGKAAPEVLQRYLSAALLQDPSAINSPDDVTVYARAHGLGIDCSGFAYHLLDPLVRARTGRGIADALTLESYEIEEALERHPERQAYLAPNASLPQRLPLGVVCGLWQKDPADITDVRRLCSELTAQRVAAASQIVPGDLLRMTSPTGDHVGVILEVSADHIDYAASEETGEGIGGVRVHTIAMNQPQADLDKQSWDQSRIYHTYGNHDGVYRLNVLMERE